MTTNWMRKVKAARKQLLRQRMRVEGRLVLRTSWFYRLFVKDPVRELSMLSDRIDRLTDRYFSRIPN